MKDYEKLFETLMEYTDFNSTDDIKGEKELNSYFAQLSKQAKTKRQKKQFTSDYSNTRQALLEGWSRIKSKGEKRENHRKSETLSNNKVYVGKTAFNTAKKDGHTIRKGEKEVYKSFYIRKNNKVMVWRDKKGRFVSRKLIEKG